MREGFCRTGWFRAAASVRWPILSIVLLLVVLAVGGTVRAAGPIPNAGFETGDLGPWTTSCLGQDGGCADRSITVGPDYAHSGQYGARLFIAREGGWGQAQLFSPWFRDDSQTYSLTMKL